MARGLGWHPPSSASILIQRKPSHLVPRCLRSFRRQQTTGLDVSLAYCGRSSSGSLAIFVAIPRVSSRVSRPVVVGRVNVGHSLPAAVTDDEARLAFVYLHCGIKRAAGLASVGIGGGERGQLDDLWAASEGKAEDRSAYLRPVGPFTALPFLSCNLWPSCNRVPPHHQAVAVAPAESSGTP